MEKKQNGVPGDRPEKERTEADEFKPFFILASVIAGIVFAAGLFVSMRFAVNEFYNLAYERGFYPDRSATTKMKPQIMEGFVPYYNTGNTDFQNGQYDKAAGNYMQALEENPPHDDEAIREHTENECKIRINLSLSLLNQIDFEHLRLNDREAVDSAIEQLLVAREVLTADECAHFDDPGGHNADAEQLKKEIDEVLKRLNYKPPQESGGGGDDNRQQQQQASDDENQQNEQSRREKELERKLNDEMSKAKEEQERSERERAQEREAGEGSDGYGYGQDPDVQAW